MYCLIAYLATSNPTIEDTPSVAYNHLQLHYSITYIILLLLENTKSPAICHKSEEITVSWFTNNQMNEPTYMMIIRLDVCKCRLRYS